MPITMDIANLWYHFEKINSQKSRKLFYRKEGSFLFLLSVEILNGYEEGKNIGILMKKGV